MTDIITLTTDFGYRDSYVGTMKGVILGMVTHAVLVDLTHGITPHSVLEAGFVLRGSYTFFPSGTLHVVVVDPGVGGTRRVLYLENKGHRFLAPDNGVLSGLLDSPDRLLSVEDESLFLSNISSTFHGRDIFAPVAARLISGLDPAELGPEAHDPVTLEWPEPAGDEGRLEGCVLYIDVYGNIVTNFDESHVVSMKPSCRVFLKGNEIGVTRNSYVDVEKGEKLALINSYGLLEIAVREGNAARKFGVGTGDEVTLTAL